ncbi:MAG: RNA-directed DNA polymerase [Bifidobacteriaceae bacterium]|jgi:hypothetical protein|nr:RNA-directed DNA polymerase [Bifidobacteriaceae bacterium]
MKFINGNLDDFLNYENILQSYENVKKGKSKHEKVRRFESHKRKNILSILKRLKNNDFKMMPLIERQVFIPKLRVIKAPQFEDRIIQDFFCRNFLCGPIEKRLIYDNAACRKNKGTHFAVNRVRNFMHQIYEKEGLDCWILKCDIRKYFYSINCEKLKSMILSQIEDGRIKQFCEQAIDCGKDKHGLGLAVGNQTSQWFAIYYLDPLDRFIKQNLKIKYYSRYMDDFILVHKSKRHLQYCADEIKNFLKSYSLQLNEKTGLFSLKHGVDYLGFRIRMNEDGKIIMKMRKDSVRKVKNKIKQKNKEINQLIAAGKIEKAAKVRDSQLELLTGWVAHAKHGNTYNLVETVLDLAKVTPKEIETGKLFHRTRNPFE